jgi:spoIIIJ-associated protein
LGILPPLMESKVSEILENILSHLLMEGSFEVNEEEEQVKVIIETEDAGRLIGVRGETLDSLQLLVNQMLSKQLEKEDEFKRVIIDVGNWRQNKESDLEEKAQMWAEQVLETGKPLELDPMPSWQRRAIHLALEKIDGVSSESIDEGHRRHLVIKPSDGTTSDEEATEDNADVSADDQVETESAESADEPTETSEDTKADDEA